MTTPKEILLGTLEDLGRDDFEKFKWHLKNNGCVEGLPAIPESKLENAERTDIVDLMFDAYSINTFEVTKNLLGSINRNDLLENLNNTIPEPKEILPECQLKLKSNLKQKFQCVLEGISTTGNPTLLNEIYTELYITEGGTAEVNDEHEVRQIETASRKPDRPETTIRQGDIFKLPPGRDKPVRTVLTMGVAGIGKTVLTQKFTLDWAEGKANQDIQFIFPFTFRELNLLREEKKRFRDEEQASRIISHIKTSRSLHIMCHIPVFCWITATVLEDELKTSDSEDLPKTLTELYLRLVLFHLKTKDIKYDGGAETDSCRKMIESLGKLAFDQLQKGNLIFYKSDLTECGIDITAASVYSGVFTQIFKADKRNMFNNVVYCFVHLSIQEFFAALHVYLTFINSGVNLLKKQSPLSKIFQKTLTVKDFYQSAVEKALESPNGHLDLFLRFLLGLSLQTNQNLLRMLTQTVSSSQTNQETVQYIKKKLSGKLSAEKSINLFHCLNELDDRSLVEEIQQSLSSGSLSTDELSPAQWSALVFILLSSDLDEFDLQKYSCSEKAFLKLLPVVKASKKVLLTDCKLSRRSFETLSEILSSSSNHLRELDLSLNKLQDSELDLLCVGLKSPDCKLETLG
ncbi:NLR family CARD domain-containing protein 3-like [Oreochromis niloticus]|uniref:NLR family CARD domain-containing protein 3-like n=1 Tax=Oreochromis niloticus TaxID=8128 RepID=UPI000DF468CE|nr:NLR family CARD domain-containing protein 3-like [Oreochromis niloticus]